MSDGETNSDGDDVGPTAVAPTHYTERGLAVRRFFRSAGQGVARYCRMDYDGPDHFPPPPALIVLNHGFGGIFDLNVFAFAGLTADLGIAEDTPVTILTHQMAFKTGLGPLLGEAGFVPAGREVARDALGDGHYVLVLPGGDLDGGKSWSQRNEVRFGGRTGFAQLAIDAGVPIVPLVIVGAGESLLVLSDGQRIARALGVDRALRNATMPVTLSIPWGFSIGLVGLLPYVPLPTKLRAAAGPTMVPADGEKVDEFAARVHGWMQEKADEMTARRIPVLGWQLGR